MNYAELFKEMQSLLGDESDGIARAANFSALLFLRLTDLNWVGFYFLQGDTLIVGPFQGKPACVRIPLGKGVCGTAALTKKTLIVPNVHEFPGHIACDDCSKSEIVVPLLRPDGSVYGVLDLDSFRYNHFDETDQAGLESLVALL